MGVFFALLLSVSAQQQYGYDQGEIWNWKNTLISFGSFALLCAVGAWELIQLYF